MILLEVRDDGVGIGRDQLKQLHDMLKHCGEHSTKSYGMCNICDRIHLLAGSEYGLEIVSELGVGTAVRLRLPTKLGGSENVSGAACR